MPGPIVLLGPQRPFPTLGEALDALDVRGPLVVINAGERHDEGETEAIAAAARREVTLLPLYQWFEELQPQEPDLFASYAERQERIQRYKELVRVRLRFALDAARTLWGRLPEDPEFGRVELDRAIEVVRRVDAGAVETLDDLREKYPLVVHRRERSRVAEACARAREVLLGAGAVVVAGGHVGVLRNRLYFFGLDHWLKETLAAGIPLLGWGAGAMCLTQRIVLFYDDPPEGPSEAEVLDTGLGLVPRVVLFPHARRRLRLDHPDRVAALASRFAPQACLGLESGAWLERRRGRWVNRGPADSAFVLQADGQVVPLETAR